MIATGAQTVACAELLPTADCVDPRGPIATRPAKQASKLHLRYGKLIIATTDRSWPDSATSKLYKQLSLSLPIEVMATVR